MKYLLRLSLLALISLSTDISAQPKFEQKLNTVVPHFSKDPTVKIDYDIVYVRAPRAGDKVHKRFFTDFSSPVTMEPGADLMLLHPDGKEELLVAGGDGSITDPIMSFDAQWVYYVHLHNMKNANQWNPPKDGGDIFKINLKSRKIVRLTNQKFTPNLGAADWSVDFRSHRPGKSHFEYGVYNTGPCPLPGGRIAFTSNRDGFRPAKGYPVIALQMFVMDDRDTDLPENDDPVNLEKIGHLNLAGALHPVVLSDGRIMYSSLESQGLRSDILWGIWTIHPDGTNWNPLVSAFDTGGAPNGFHFQTQLSDSSVVVEEYYNQNNSGFGAYIKIPKPKDDQYANFGPAYMNDPKNNAWRYGRFDNGNPQNYRMPFMPLNSVSLTPFTHGVEGPAGHAVLKDKTSPSVGKYTHPSGAPDNHMLTCYSPGPVNHQYVHLPQIDGGIYLIKKGEVVNEPSEMLLIKNDPNYNECWPRAVVPYERVHGIKEPKIIPRLENQGKLSKHLPAGTPFALIGTSSFYKRESYPNGKIEGVTGIYAGGRDPWKGLDAFTSHGNGPPLNWHNQGAEAGLYTNEDVHAVRILAMEPTTDRKGANAGRLYHNHAGERLRILGEIPLRKFDGGKQPVDPDGNPDTSFLAKIPADVGFTFQAIDRRGMVLNMAQTWHQLRPGELRVDCGGCHAHSQKPTDFNLTLAAKDNYDLWDLTKSTPLLTEKSRDESKKQWDTKGDTGLKVSKTGPISPEYFKDIKPILAQSCVQCHSSKNDKKLAAGLDLDADDQLVQVENKGKFPGTYYRLAADETAKFGPKPPGWDSWGYPNASRYIRKFQSRRSLLVWKIYGERLDGFQNEDHPSEDKPGSGKLFHKGVEMELQKTRAKYDIDLTGDSMPAGQNATPITDEQKRTIVRWIDLGCPIDLDAKSGFGWSLDDQRPTVALTLPGDRILVGLYDHGSGLDLKTLRITAEGIAGGQNIADKFTETSAGVWEMPAKEFKSGTITVQVADKQGNVTTLRRAIQPQK